MDKTSFQFSELDLDNFINVVERSVSQQCGQFQFNINENSITTLLVENRPLAQVSAITYCDGKDGIILWKLQDSIYRGFRTEMIINNVHHLESLTFKKKKT